MNKHVSGGLLIALSMFLFSLIGPFIRYVKLPLLVIIFYPALFASIILLFYFIFTKKLKEIFIKNYLLWVISSAFLIAGNLYTYFKAYTTTTLANSVLTHYTAPVFAALLAPVLLKEKLERITIISLLISMAGLFLIASNEIALGSQHLEGITYGALSGLFYGILILVDKKLTNNFQSTVILFYQSVITAILIAPFCLGSQHTIALHNFVQLTAYTLIVFLLPAFLYLKGLRYVEAQHAGILAYTEPVVVVLTGILFYNEIPSISILAGGILIICSGYLILRAEAGRG